MTKKGINWREHISSTCKKANRTLAFLRRHLSQCPEDIKVKAYEVYVRPTLEYSSNVWDPYQHKYIDQLESIQKRAARFACNQYNRETSVSKLQSQLKWKSLKERRAKSKVTMIFRARKQLCHIPTEDLRLNNNKRTHRASNSYDIPRSRTNVHLYSFYPSAIRLWNHLPENIKATSSLDSFKIKLSNIVIKSDKVTYDQSPHPGTKTFTLQQTAAKEKASSD